MATSQTALRCACGALQGTLRHRGPVDRIACMCRGCRAYARWLGREAQMLDEHGGTDIYQITPSQLSLHAGLEHLACVRLTPGGALRWHASCCRSAVANSLASPRVPWLGMPHTFVDAPRPLGPRRYRINAGDDAPKVQGAHRRGPVALVLRTLVGSSIDFVRGRHRPTPLFDDRGRPVVEPRPLGDDERRRFGLVDPPRGG